MEAVFKQHIEMRPSEIHGQVPCIAGTRIRVLEVYVWYELRGMSAHEIVDQFPHLTMADVHPAMTYYWDHREEVQQELRLAKEIAEANRRQANPVISQFPGTFAPDIAPIPS